MAFLSALFECIGWYPSSTVSESQPDDNDREGHGQGVSNPSRPEEIILIDIEFAYTDLIVRIFERESWEIQYYRWHKFRTIPDAVNAIATAKWSYEALQKAAQAVYERRYQRGTVEKLRVAARRKRLLARIREKQ